MGETFTSLKVFFSFSTPTTAILKCEEDWHAPIQHLLAPKLLREHTSSHVLHTIGPSKIEASSRLFVLSAFGKFFKASIVNCVLLCSHNIVIGSDMHYSMGVICTTV